MSRASRISRILIIDTSETFIEPLSHDIFHWVNAFLRTGMHKDLHQFPKIEFFVPKLTNPKN